MNETEAELADYEAIKRRHTANGRDRDWRELDVISFDDMQPRLDGRPLIKGVLEQEQISLTAGETGCGKTFFNLDRDLHIAAGWDWFERRVSQGAVCYVAAEAGRSIINRVAAFRQHHGITKSLPFTAVTTAIDLCHPNSGDLQRLVDAIQNAGAPPALVEIDTVSRVLAGGDENSAADMGMLVRSLDNLRDRLRCHVSAIHHLGKDVARGPRGHSLLKAAVDTVIEISRDEISKVSTASIVKQRDGATEGQFAFRLRQVELGVDQDGDPVTSCIVQADHAGDARPAPQLGKLTAAARVGLDQLKNCMADQSVELPVSAHIPIGIRGVTLTYWRNYLEKAAVINPEGNPREQFRRIRVTLQERGFIGVWNDFVWLSHAVTQASQ